MNKTLTSILLAACAAFGLAGGARTAGAQITYDGFSYSAGSVHSQNGGSGWATAWDTQAGNSNYQVQSSSPLSYGGLQTSGNYITGGGAFESTGRRISVGFGSDWDAAGRVSDPFGSGGFGAQLDQGVVWASFLVRRNASVASWDGMDVRFHRANDGWSGNNDNTSLQISYDTTNSNWRAAGRNGNGQGALPNSALGDTVLFVAKFELSLTAGANAIHVWFNPSTGSLGGADLATGTADWSLTGLNTADARFRSFSFYSGSASGATSLDEVRLGTSYASVTAIPEPSTYALVGLGMGMLAWVRCRMRRS